MPQESPKDGRVGGLNLHYEYPMYMDYVEPAGALTIDKRSHACFHYTKLAMRARYLHNGGIENQQITYKVGEAPPDYHESRDEEIARSVAILYGLESPDEFLKFKDRAWAQATQFLGLPVELEIYNVRPGIARLQ